MESYNRRFGDLFGAPHPGLLKFVEDLEEEAIRVLGDAEWARAGVMRNGTERAAVEWPEIPEDFESFNAPRRKK